VDVGRVERGAGVVLVTNDGERRVVDGGFDHLAEPTRSRHSRRAQRRGR
jgi:hypothetical protein